MVLRLIFFIMITCYSAMGISSPPKAFASLAQELSDGFETVQALQKRGPLQSETKSIEAFEAELEHAFELGHRLDATVDVDEKDGSTAALRKAYLKALRKAQSTQKRFYRRYIKALDAAIKADDREAFSALVEHRLEPLEHESVKERVKRYYETKRRSWKLEAAETLLAEMELVRASREAYAKELQAYQTQFALSLADSDVPPDGKRLLKRFRNVSLYSVREASNIGIYAHNENVYSVTAGVRFTNVTNFQFEGDSETDVELAPDGWKKVTALRLAQKHGKASFNIGMKLMMGWASARHDESYTYRVPFESGKRVLVSQGFDGGVTHTGDSRYAVDFQVPIGTPIVAARDGRVVATEAGNNQAGFDMSYAKFANYIVIEHDDHTYGQYAHLKQNGVLVKPGDRVTKGQKIGYSGNTGYSSGPHLHFEVIKVDSKSRSKMISIPVRFKSDGKLVGSPRTGDIFVSS